MKKFITDKFPLIILLILFGFLFFFRLGSNSLNDWDEAWYASIAKTMLKTGRILQMEWYGGPFTDHPPLGIWLMASSFKILGVNEFSVRFPSAILGLFSIILIYQLGKLLFNKKVIGFAAALILGTSVWFIFRVRSGNLDAIFSFFYLLTVYFSIKSVKNFKYFPITLSSFALLLLTKTIVGWSALILIIFLNWQQIIRYRQNYKYIWSGIFLFFLIVLPWYLYQYFTVDNFIQNHFFRIATRNKSFLSFFDFSFSRPLFLFHMGVRKWYYPCLASLAYLVMRLKYFRNKNIALILIWFIIAIFPFLSSQATEIWHLIPVYLPMSLIIGFAVFDAGSTILKWSRLSKKIFYPLFACGYLLLFSYAALIQIKNFYKEIIPSAKKSISQEADISLKAKNTTGALYLDDEFLPVATFYSNRSVRMLKFEKQEIKERLAYILTTTKDDLTVITRKENLNYLNKNNIPYKILNSNASYVLVTK